MNYARSGWEEVGVPSGRALTNLSRKVFSRRAPMQPAKPSTDMMPPTTTNSHTGSRPPRSVSAEMLERTPCEGRAEANGGGWPSHHLDPEQPHTLPHRLTFSPQAQRPMARNRAPSTCRSSSKELRAGAPASFPTPSRAPSPLLLRVFRKPGGKRERGERAVNGIQGLSFLFFFFF